VDAFGLAALAGALFGALVVAVRTGLTRAPEPELGPFVMSLAGCAIAAVAAAASGSFGDVSAGDVWPFVLIGAGVPGASTLVFVRAIRDAGPARAAVLIGTAPVISAALAVAFLGEPLQAALGIATVLIVVGGAALAGETGRPEHFKAIGAVFALCCAVLFAARDNLVRVVVRDGGVPPLAAATASLAGGALLLLLYLAVVRRRRALDGGFLRALPAFLPAAVLLATAYAALLEAFDRGRVTVVAPLNATQSLWAVVLSAVFLRRSESIGRRLVLAAILIVAGSALIGATR
jgi:drug/metabolite transporter (DMT)-like permease